MTRVIVCGGRNFRSPAQVWCELDRLHAIHHFRELMQGGAIGVDTFAREWVAKHHEVISWTCRAEWDKYGKAAGPKRNARMLEWDPNLVIAFPGGRGTADMVRRAKAAGVQTICLFVD